MIPQTDDSTRLLASLSATVQAGSSHFNDRSLPVRSMFVIKLHHATRLHFDFRILDGRVLKSWVLPDGPSMNPDHLQEAILVGDHAPSYAYAERRIPQGLYGAGPMLVWDTGFIYHTTKILDRYISLDHALRIGRIDLELDGLRLKGGFSLTRISRSENPWVLTKMEDDEADYDYEVSTAYTTSVLSGLTLEEIGRTPYAQMQLFDLSG